MGSKIKGFNFKIKKLHFAMAPLEKANFPLGRFVINDPFFTSSQRSISQISHQLQRGHFGAHFASLLT
jgi:hypothetical protein